METILIENKDKRVTADKKTPSADQQCIACRENIIVDALICPKCHSPQKTQPWDLVLLSLKWIGGITALISLVIGVFQLRSIVKDWKERDEAVRQIVAASTMLVEMKDYETAWNLVEKGTKMAPNSQIGFDQQVNVAMAWLRNFWIQKKQTSEKEILDQLILTLIRGAGTKNTKRSAKVLAHIGWANYLRKKDGKYSYEIESYISQAIEKNPEGTYTNLFAGWWLLNVYNEKNRVMDDQMTLTNAKAHFKKAIKNVENSPFIFKRQLSAFKHSEVKNADIEVFKIANQWRKQKNLFFHDSKKKAILKSLYHYIYSRFNEPFAKDSFLLRLSKTYSLKEIRDTCFWLLREEHSQKQALRRKKYILGIIAELKNELNTAFDSYLSLLDLSLESASHYRYLGRNCLYRIISKCSEKNILLPGVQIPPEIVNTIVLNDQEKLRFNIDSLGMNIQELFEGPLKKGGLMIKDIILNIDGADPDKVNGYSLFHQMVKDISSGKKPYGDLLIIRDKKLKHFRVVKSTREIGLSK